MTAVLDGDKIIITDVREPEMKALGARWVASLGAWTLPAARMHAAALVDAGLAPEALRAALVGPSATLDDDRLYPYQRTAAGRVAIAPHGQLEVISPGLGKTAIAVRASDTVVPFDERIVVVAPASLLRTWEREIKKWSLIPPTVYVVSGAIDFDAAAGVRWIVVSWDRVARDTSIWGKGWPLWILDESVMTKSRRTQRFKALNKLRGQVKRFWLLSGSPVTRYSDDLWAQLHLLWPAAFPSYWRFAERYCYVEETVWSKVVTGDRPNRDVIADNADLITVVNQEDVLELPEYFFEVIDVDLPPKQRKAYDAMAQEFVAELGDGTEIVAQNEISRLGKLQQITSYWDGVSAKHDALLDLIGEYEEPHLIWTHWREGASALTERLQLAGHSVEHVDGSTAPKERDRVLESFKAGEFDVLVLSIGVGKFGHTFTNAKTIWYVDKTWNADDYFQSLHRVRRIGLTHRPVVVTIRAPGTVDELVEDNLEGKLGGISRITKSRLAELLRGIGR